MINKSFVIIAGVAAAALCSPLILFAQATAPTLFIDWRAHSFVSPSYLGKILPTAGTPITLSFELIDANKIADVSKNQIRWFVDGKLLKSGLGLKNFDFTTAAFGVPSHRIKIAVVDYKGGEVDGFATIPVARPEIQIKTQPTGNTLTSGTAIFKALFYFWNVASPEGLAISWQANGAEATGAGDASTVTLTIPQVTIETPITLTVSAKNPTNELESANAAITLTIKP